MAIQRGTLLKVLLIGLGVVGGCALPFLGLERFENDQAPLLIAFAALAFTGGLIVHLVRPHALEAYVSGAVMVFALLSLMGIVGLLAEMPASGSVGLNSILPMGGR